MSAIDRLTPEQPAPAPDPEQLAVAALALARRFEAGATMWCVAPAWRHHARHLAVEFVHPVIVGKRALPAVAVAGADALRAVAAAGDALVVVAAADDRDAADLLARAQAWGLVRFWIGAGDPPPPGAADHVLWVGGDPWTADVGGAVVRAYHVLWELTHVCLEHRSLVPPSVDGSVGERCITCSDDATVVEVVDRRDGGLATVRTPGGVESVDTTLVGDVAPGDLLLVHAGTAIERAGVARG